MSMPERHMHSSAYERGFRGELTEAIRTALCREFPRQRAIERDSAAERLADVVLQTLYTAAHSPIGDDPQRP